MATSDATHRRGRPPETAVLVRGCPICEAGCGLLLTVDAQAGRVLSIRGDPENPHSRGYVCPRSQAIREVHEDPERLRAPVRRTADGRFEEISWEEAFAFVGERLRGIRERHGADAIGFYYGNPNISDLGGMLYMPMFTQLLGTQRFFSPTAVDQLPRNLTSALLYGGAWLIPIPDVDRSDFFVCMGANPLVSQGSLMSAPGIGKRLAALQARGGRLVVIDPRRTQTAAVADRHLFIRPGTDALLLFAWVSELFARDAVRLGHLAGCVEGLDELRELAAPFTPESVAEATGVAASDLRALIDDFLAARAPVLYGRLGLCTQEFGTLATWLVDVVNILCGRLDAEGGAMFPRPYLGQSEHEAGTGELPFGRWRTRVRGLPEFEGQLPAAAMAEEITDAPEAERMRALITIAGNPVLTVPNGKRLREAARSLELMIAVDFYINETTSLADVILPPTTKLETGISNLFYAVTSVRNFAFHAPPTFEPAAGAQHQWQIMLQILAHLNGTTLEALDDLMFAGITSLLAARLEGVDAQALRDAAGPVRGPERLLDLLMRAGPFGDRFGGGEGLSLQALLDNPHGIDLGPLQSWAKDLLRTPDGRLSLVHEIHRSDVPRLVGALGRNRADGRYLLIGRRHLRDMNSWLRHLGRYASGRPRCTLLVHPADAAREGLRHAGRARVSSPTGEIEVEVCVSDEMMPGVVSLPHGFGNRSDGTRPSRAAALQPGASCNDVISEFAVDVAGTSIVNGAPVRLTPL